jgi:catechol 2,3-dioxygenase-like lactoylglutathione lyase family enzyme
MIRGVKFVGIPVKNQDAALKFWTEKVGLKIATDQEMGPGQRWIELSIPGAETGLALFTPEGMKIASERFSPSASGATTWWRRRRRWSRVE